MAVRLPWPPNGEDSPAQGSFVKGGGVPLRPISFSRCELLKTLGSIQTNDLTKEVKAELARQVRDVTCVG